MARHKEFDTTKVLSKALECFCNSGYEGTSVQELLKHLGIAKQSMYDTYGNKRDIYIAALKLYSEQKINHLVQTLEGDRSKKEAIIRSFHDLIDDLANPKQMKVCLMVKTAIELAQQDQEMAHLVEANMEKQIHAYYHALTCAQSQGELNKDRKDLMALARFLNNAQYGLLVTALSTSDTTVLHDSVKLTLSILD